MRSRGWSKGVLLAALVTAGSALAQGGASLQWEYGYTAPSGIAAGADLAVAPDGTLVIAGLTDPSSDGGNILVLKLDAAKNLLWEQNFGDDGSQRPVAVAVDAAGSVYVAGDTDNDVLLLKYSAQGQLAWSRVYDGPASSSDNAVDLTVDAQGNPILVASSRGVGTRGDFATLKYNPAGALLWERRYDGPGSFSDFPEAITADAAGNVYVTGSARTENSDDDYVTIKYAASGVMQWTRTFDPGEGTDEYARDVAVDGTGNVYVTGIAGGTVDFEDYWAATLKYNSAGELQWERRVQRPDGRGARGDYVFVDGTGGIRVTGTAEDGAVTSDFFAARYTADGTPQWVRYYNGPVGEDDEVADSAIDSSGQTYITGYSEGEGAPEIATLRYDADGNLVWSERYASAEGGEAGVGALAVDDARNVYLTGETENAAHLITLRYLQEPAPPTSFTAVAGAGPSVSLSWVPGSGVATSFELRRRTAGGSYGAPVSVSGAITTYLDAAVQPSTGYLYQLRAVNGVGSSDYTAEVSVTVPTAVSGKLTAPKQLKFGKVRVGMVKTVTAKIKNTHRSEPLTLTISAPSRSEFALVNPGGTMTIAPKGTLLVPVRFTPIMAGKVPGTLHLVSSDPAKPAVDVSLVAAGSAAR